MKKLALLTMTLMVTLIAAAPALAQSSVDQYGDGSGTGESISATGVIEKPEMTSYMYGTHAMTDQASDTQYALQSEVVDLDLYTGERVTIYGTLVPGYEDGRIEGGPSLVDVTRVERVEESGAPTEHTRTGSIITVNGDGIFVSEDPSLSVEDPGYCEKTYEFLIYGDTGILRQQNGELVPAGADDLQAGQSVEVTYTETPGEAIPAICPPQRTADKIVILGENPEVPREDPPDKSVNPPNKDSANPGNNDKTGKSSKDGPTLLPDTGGITLPVAGAAALMIAGGLLVRRLILQCHFAGIISREPRLSETRALLCTICGTDHELCYWAQTPLPVGPATKSRCP